MVRYIIVYLLPLVTFPNPTESLGRRVCIFPEPQKVEEIACDRVGKASPCILETQQVVRYLCDI